MWRRRRAPTPVSEKPQLKTLEVPNFRMDRDYFREHGVRHYDIPSIGIVSVVSQPNWDDFFATIQEQPKEFGNLILSPELITAADLNFSDINHQRKLIQNRLDEVYRLSVFCPEITYAIGTPVFDQGRGGPTNSVVYIREGEFVARQNKQVIFSGTEEDEVFRTDRYPGPTSPDPGSTKRIATLVCADLTSFAFPSPNQDYPQSNTIRSTTEVVLVSACWGVPLELGGYTFSDPRPDEERYRTSLEACVRGAFESYPGLDHVVVADRVAAGSSINGPLNCHFKRVDIVGSI